MPGEPPPRSPSFIQRLVGQRPAPAPTAPPITPSDQPAAPEPEPVIEVVEVVTPEPEQPPAVLPGQPLSRQPTAVHPAPPKKRIAQPTPPPGEPDYKPGDLICGNCGAGNDPQRRFCRRCGTSLVEAIVARRPPWYRRIFRRRDRALAAGERPKHMGRKEKRRGRSMLRQIFRVRKLAFTLVAIAALAGGAGYALLPDVRSQVDNAIADVRCMVMPPNPLPAIFPITTVGASVGQNTATRVADNNTATYWVVDPEGNQTITFTFEQEFELGGLIFHTSSEAGAGFLLHQRPRSVQITFPETGAQPITLELTDSDEPLINQVSAGGVTVIQMRILSAYPAGEDGANSIAIREIEFRNRSCR